VSDVKDRDGARPSCLEERSDGETSQHDVCLLSMPYPIIDQPSVALGLLQGALEKRGITTKSFFPCLWFAEEIGLDVLVDAPPGTSLYDLAAVEVELGTILGCKVEVLTKGFLATDIAERAEVDFLPIP
jgi:hypothetical protein